MFTGGDACGFIAQNLLITIKIKSMLGLSRKAQNRQGQGPVVHAIDLLSERSRRERGVQRRSTQLQRRTHSQYHGDQRNKAEYTKTQRSAQRQHDSNRQDRRESG